MNKLELVGLAGLILALSTPAMAHIGAHRDGDGRPAEICTPKVRVISADENDPVIFHVPRGFKLFCEF